MAKSKKNALSIEQRLEVQWRLFRALAVQLIDERVIDHKEFAGDIYEQGAASSDDMVTQAMLLQADYYFDHGPWQPQPQPVPAPAPRPFLRLVSNSANDNH